MSRIDEALRRAAADSATAGRDSPLTSDEVAQRKADLTLDQYPRERPGHMAILDRPEKREGHQPVAEFPPVATLRAAAVEPAVPRNLLALTTDPPILAEQYRKLAAVLHAAQVERGLKTITITSASPHPGKTLAAVNLAIVLGESHARRVLLIDADLRHPSVHDVLGISNDAGLSEALQTTRLGLRIVEVSPLLNVLTAGQPQSDPLAGLASNRMRLLLEECADRFDWLLLDTPALSVLSDAQLLARRTGATVLVIDAASEPLPVIEKALEDLGRERVIGTVLSGLGG